MNDDIMGALSVDRGSESIIMVAGVGGAGGNAVRYMYELGIEGVEFMVCNTDEQSLDKSPIECKIKLGNDGLGAGNNPEVGRLAAIESLEAIKSKLKSSNTKMLFITAGMGGGTGTGASPVIAKMAKEEGILTVAIVTSPLTLEGKSRHAQAVEGIDKLKQHVDSILIINNDNILVQYKDLSLFEAFRKADDILCSAAKGIAEIITVKSELVNVDFADVKRVMVDSGTAHMSVTSAEGEDRAQRVAEESLTSPLLNKNLISGAKNILLNFVTEDLKGLAAEELRTVLDYIQSNATVLDANGVMRDANVIWGTSTKANLGKKLELVVVATGFDSGRLDPEGDNAEGEGDGGSLPQKPVVVEPPKAPVAKPQPQPKQVVLGSRKSRYANIDQLSKQPAYKTRKMELIVTSSSNKRELLKDSNTEKKVVDDSLLFK